MQSSENQTIGSIRLKSGNVSLGPSPSATVLASLRNTGVTHIVTTLTQQEDAHRLGALAEQAGLTWTWMPFTETIESNVQEQAFLQQYLLELVQRLSEGQWLYLHCDEGMTRCQLLLVALCHACGMPSSSTYNALHSINRQQTNQLPRAALHWAAQLGASL